MKEWTVVYEHPEYGEAYVTWHWVNRGRGGGWSIEPLTVEFPFLCPEPEQDILTDLLLRDGQMWYELGFRPGSEQDPEYLPTSLPWTATDAPEPPAEENSGPD